MATLASRDELSGQQAAFAEEQQKHEAQLGEIDASLKQVAHVAEESRGCSRSSSGGRPGRASLLELSKAVQTVSGRLQLAENELARSDVGRGTPRRRRRARAPRGGEAAQDLATRRATT